jgi:hypothetical protein
MRSSPKIWLFCLWIAVLAASPYIYANSKILDPLIFILFFWGLSQLSALSRSA